MAISTHIPDEIQHPSKPLQGRQNGICFLITGKCDGKFTFASNIFILRLHVFKLFFIATTLQWPEGSRHSSEGCVVSIYGISAEALSWLPTVVRLDRLKRTLEERPPLVLTHDHPENGKLKVVKMALKDRNDGVKSYRYQWDRVV